MILTEDVPSQLEDLKLLCARLHAAMLQSALELREHGIEPSVELLDQMRLCRSQFRDVRQQLGLTADESSAALSLTDLERLYHLRERVHVAVSVLDVAESLVHQTDPDFAPLARLHVECRELRDALSLPQPSPELIAALEQGQHPVAAAVTLVRDGDSLSDEAWERHQSAVQSKFGRELATALARGRMTVGPARS